MNRLNSYIMEENNKIIDNKMIDNEDDKLIEIQPQPVTYNDNENQSNNLNPNKNINKNNLIVSWFKPEHEKIVLESDLDDFAAISDFGLRVTNLVISGLFFLM